jgi:hypothetical protein
MGTPNSWALSQVCVLEDVSRSYNHQQLRDVELEFVDLDMTLSAMSHLNLFDEEAPTITIASSSGMAAMFPALERMNMMLWSFVTWMTAFLMICECNL